MEDRNCQEVFLSFKFKREWFRSIESLLVLRKSVAEFLTLEIGGGCWPSAGLLVQLSCAWDEKSQTADQSLIRIVVPDPEPVKGIFLENSQSTIAATDPNGPNVSRFFESKGRMTGISLPQSIRQLGLCLDLRREDSIGVPKIRSCR